MTDRLYYTDSTTREFEATVLAAREVGGRPAVVLDRTAFYPTSGGQPFDTGTLDDQRVVEVVDQEDGDIAHVLEHPIAVGAVVRGAIDWPRRFDHMQQHTGQHILSAAFDRAFGVRTTSFHLGADTSTIDLARVVTPAEIGAAEAEANRVVWEDRLVGVRFVEPDEAASLAFRKAPARTGTLRVIEVAEFDVSACGGTHVPSTGAIGLIAVAGWERFKGGSRIAFVCGGRALASHARLRDIVLGASRTLSVGADELGAAVDRLQADQKASQRTLALLQGEVAAARANALREQAVAAAGRRVVLASQPDLEASALKTLALAITRAPGMVAVLVGNGQPCPVVAAAALDASFDCHAWLKAAISALGGRGGGRPELAQGGVSAEAGAILAHARAALDLPVV